jgi:type II secretion system protein H
VQRAFTLVEILVVVVVLAIGAAVAVVALAPDERGIVEREARRFAGALEHAALRAQLAHATLGVSATSGDSGSGWRFWSRSADGRWVPLDDDTLAARSLPAPVALVPLAFAGRAVAPDAIVPLRASGRNDPYAFALRGNAYEAIVAADPLNRVAVDGPRSLPR